MFKLPPTSIPKELKPKEEDPSQVQFLGPIPEPVQLPPKWKCAKDKYGRPYYYHVKIRKSQWIPPPLNETPAIEEAECKSYSQINFKTNVAVTAIICLIKCNNFSCEVLRI